MSTTSGGNISTFSAELGHRFPTFNACINKTRGRESHNSSSRSSVIKNSKKRKPNNINTQDASDLVIIPNPDTKQVPSHSNKVKLEERELIIHEFPFNKGWSPLELRENIEKQLSKNVFFEFMKACYGTLVVPKLAEGVRMNGERILKFSGQGSVYIRCLEPLEEEDDEDQELLQPVFSDDDT
ncbi:Hypothetical predicted protein [Paramuricea clavata]|uniref:Uncharacterized protein n=1 Tax=Paramuricea clavata TaxID=317549 RepID=A0A7D9D4S2_PARCT|nr:Hypothetical predicted protein [Paramuricea clavata]